MKKIFKKQKLSFINNSDLYKHTELVIKTVLALKDKNDEENFFSNSVDPFSALFDITIHGMDYSEWKKQEVMRQDQKTLQNAIGNFHQNILGDIKGWNNLGVGGGLDVINKNKKIVAEIKNKHNTLNGEGKVAIYDKLKNKLKKDYLGYVGYYVEIIPKNKKVYDEIFTPPCNIKKKNRPKNENIRRIDGNSFYDLATGKQNSLRELYNVLPEVIGDILDKKDYKKIKNNPIFKELFEKVY